MKCPKCGYKFKGDSQAVTGFCPLCSEQYVSEEAIEYYALCCGNEDSGQSDRKSASKAVLDWVIFGISFAAFIIILNVIITFIARA